MCISPVWGSPTADTVAKLPRTVVLSVALADGDRLKDRLAKGEAVTATLHSEVDTRWRPTPILVAEMSSPNGGADEPFVMFSGHHDTWHYGVMDNGTANATMVEVARLCATQRAGWQRGLRVCFWSGHSHGRYSGSTWYADEHWDDLDRRCAAHVNIDSTGGKGATVLTDALTASELRKFGHDMVATEGQETIGLRMSRAGDQSFWGIGVPSMFMGMGEQPAGRGTDVAGGVLGSASTRNGAGFGWWWHTPDDTLDKIDPVLLQRDARIYVHTLWHLLHDAVLPLDYAQWASDFLGELEKLRALLGNRFDVSPLVKRAEQLRANATKLREGARPDAAARINQRAHAGLARAGADRLHQRRPLRPRPGTRSERLSAARSDPPTGVRQGWRRGKICRGRRHARTQPRRPCTRSSECSAEQLERRGAFPPTQEDWHVPHFRGFGGDGNARRLLQSFCGKQRRCRHCKGSDSQQDGTQFPHARGSTRQSAEGSRPTAWARPINCARVASAPAQAADDAGGEEIHDQHEQDAEPQQPTIRMKQCRQQWHARQRIGERLQSGLQIVLRQYDDGGADAGPYSVPMPPITTMSRISTMISKDSVASGPL